MPIDTASLEPAEDADTEGQAEPETGQPSALQKVEALLNPPADGAEQATEPESKPPAEKLTVQALAEKLQADPATIYALEVPLADGETVTLGQLKDVYRNAEKLTKEREALTEDRSRYDVERRQSQQELDELLRVLPRHAITPELIALAQSNLKQTQATEREALLAAVPEWKDPLRMTADQGVMEQYVAAYGFTKHDLAGVTDHRLLRLVRAAALREKALKELKPEAKQPANKVAMPVKAPKGASPAVEHGRLKAAVTTRRIQPVDAVSQLLKGQGYGR